MKRVLMVAFHFPPLAGSSGIQRTLRFVQYLPDFGWEPLVLTIRPQAYARTSSDLDAEVPAHTVVRRAFGLDTARQLAFGKRYVASMARPDRWVSWRFDGVRQGMKMIRALQPAVIWSTYPIATAHLIGAALHRRSGLPWLADFRDPMAQPGYPADPVTRQQFKAIEEQALREASLSTFTTPGAARLYAQRYPDAAPRIAVLENGFDEDAFVAAGAAGAAGESLAPCNPGAITLLHSGIVYPLERDPTHLFAALRTLSEAGLIVPGRFRVRFRAPAHDQLLHTLAAQNGVQPFIEVCPPLPYTEALQEMLRADGLLVLQADNCNDQIPAKIYEYLRARRPILCLSDPAGDTEAALRAAGIRSCARLDSAREIHDLISRFVSDSAAGRLEGYLPDDAAVAQASRQGRTQMLAALLDKLAARP
jgi:hypothetical protein